MQPETKYARLGPDRIAYQVLGAGPPDLVMTTGSVYRNLKLEDPHHPRQGGLYGRTQDVGLVLPGCTAAIVRRSWSRCARS
mgnify:CR=1 FL=1